MLAAVGSAQLQPERLRILAAPCPAVLCHSLRYLELTAIQQMALCLHVDRQEIHWLKNLRCRAWLWENHPAANLNLRGAQNDLHEQNKKNQSICFPSIFHGERNAMEESNSSRAVKAKNLSDQKIDKGQKKEECIAEPRKPQDN
jgi:hypothetical protein